MSTQEMWSGSDAAIALMYAQTQLPRIVDEMGMPCETITVTPGELSFGLVGRFEEQNIPPISGSLAINGSQIALQRDNVNTYLGSGVELPPEEAFRYLDRRATTVKPAMLSAAYTFAIRLGSLPVRSVYIDGGQDPHVGGIERPQQILFEGAHPNADQEWEITEMVKSLAGRSYRTTRGSATYQVDVPTFAQVINGDELSVAVKNFTVEYALAPDSYSA